MSTFPKRAFIQVFDESLPPDYQLVADELTKRNIPYETKTTDGKIVDVIQYRGPQHQAEKGYVALDMTVVNNAVDILFESEEGKELTGCGIDFAILRIAPEEYVTCLVEVNDGFSLGRYEGLSGKAYTDLLIARWEKLVEPLS